MTTSTDTKANTSRRSRNGRRKSEREPTPALRARDTEQVAQPTLRGPNPEVAQADEAQPQVLDRALQAQLAKLTNGVAPGGMLLAYLDWLIHLGFSPSKHQQLFHKAGKKMARWLVYAQHAASTTPTEPCIEPLAQDRRFASDDWQQWPFNLIYQGFLLNQQWWHVATTGVRGVKRKNEEIVEFATRQLLDHFAPSNFPWANPEVIRATAAEGGMNLVRGGEHFLEDWNRWVAGEQPAGTDAYRVGRDVAVTPGEVVYQNRLIEVMQYAPSTASVHAEPILIIPAWIMKYYILDLSPHNSLVKYLVDQGHTVFMMSWKNPISEDRDLGLEDYRRFGAMAALDAVSAIVPEQKIHAVGYCLGGLLLSLAAAAMARDGDDRLASVSLFTTQVDYTEAGELMLFINDTQVDFLESMMWEQGYLDGKQMAGSFQLLRSNDLIWSRMIHDYLLGKRRGMSDLMAWNADLTRLPYRMHSEYLRRLYLDNDLAQGRYLVDGRPVSVTDIRAPMFAVGAERDHVAPWRSVYKLHLLTDTDLSFCLTSGGHNAGIVSEPGHARRHFRHTTRQADDKYVDPDAWYGQTRQREGSWWPTWQAWLVERSSGLDKPPSLGAPAAGYPPIGDAPGTYVFQV